MSARTICLAAAVGAVVISASTFANTWQGGNFLGPDSMSLGANWSGGTPTSSTTTDLVFPFSPGSYQPNQNIAPTLNIRTFALTGSNYVFSGPGYAFANPTSNSFSTGNGNTILVPFAFNGPTTFTGGNSPLQGLLSGSGALTITGGQFHVDPNVNNTFGGGVFLNGGSIFVPSGTTTAFNSPFFNLTDASNLNIQGNNRLGGSPNLTLNNTGSFNPSAFFTGSQSVGNIILNGGGATVTATNQLTVLGGVTSTGGGSTVNSGALIDLNGTSHIFNTPLATDALNFGQSMTNGTFTKVGAGTMSLLSVAPNNFSSPITVSAGTLNASASALTAGAINNGSIVVQTYGGALSNPISGTGSITLQTGVTYNTLNSYGGGTFIDGSINGSLTAQASNLHGTITGVFGGYVILNEPAGSSTFGATLTGSANLVKQNSGRSVIANANSFSGTTQISGGTLALADDNALGTSFIDAFLGNLEAIGTRNIANIFNGGIIAQNNSGMVGSGNVVFSNAGPKSLPSGATYTHASTGSTTYNGKFVIQSVATLNVNSGILTLGDASAVNGFVGVVGSQINVNGGTLSLKSLNFISLPDVTLAGGTLNVPNGYAIPLGAALQGTGAVTGRVASANGSTIIANGSLALGDGSHVAGVNLDGELYTQQFNVTLNDSNQSVLGSLTQIGTGSATGSLTAPKGLVLNFGRNITGRGDVNTGNTLANASILNGAVSGDGFTFGIDALNFTGYVKGVGTFNNTFFSGTYAPGLSPALVNVGMIGFAPSNVLDMELGGLNRGTQYDAIDATTMLALGGTLKLSLINSFNPALGNQFNLFDGPMTGTFSGFNFPTLSPGLAWDTSLLYTQGIVQVVLPEPTTLAALGGLTLMSRRRRR